MKEQERNGENNAADNSQNQINSNAYQTISDSLSQISKQASDFLRQSLNTFNQQSIFRTAAQITVALETIFATSPTFLSDPANNNLRSSLNAFRSYNSLATANAMLGALGASSLASSLGLNQNARKASAILGATIASLGSIDSAEAAGFKSKKQKHLDAIIASIIDSTPKSEQKSYENFLKQIENMRSAFSKLEFKSLIKNKIEGETLLHAAVISKNKLIVEKLISLGCDINKVNDLNMTPLQAAADNKDEETFRILLEAGADFTAKKLNGATPLHSASMSGNLEIAKLLIEKLKTLPEEDGKKFLNAVNIYNQTALIIAINHKHSELAEILIEAGADLTIKESSYQANSLHHAIQTENFQVAEIIIDKSKELQQEDREKFFNTRDIKGHTPLYQATVNKNPRLVKALLEAGADYKLKYDRHDEYLLHLSIRNRQKEITRLFVEQLLKTEEGKKYLATNDPIGASPLLHAIAYGDTEAVRMMIENEVEYTGKNTYGLNSLSLAIEKGHQEIVKLLIKKSQELPEADRKKFLNAIDSQGQNALHFATYHGQTNIVKELLEAGIDHSIKDNNGITALDLVTRDRRFAQKNGYRKIVGILKEASKRNKKSKEQSSNSQDSKSYSTSSTIALSSIATLTALVLSGLFLRRSQKKEEEERKATKRKIEEEKESSKKELIKLLNEHCEPLFDKKLFVGPIRWLDNQVNVTLKLTKSKFNQKVADHFSKIIDQNKGSFFEHKIVGESIIISLKNLDLAIENFSKKTLEREELIKISDDFLFAIQKAKQPDSEGNNLNKICAEEIKKIEEQKIEEAKRSKVEQEEKIRKEEYARVEKKLIEEKEKLQKIRDRGKDTSKLENEIKKLETKLATLSPNSANSLATNNSAENAQAQTTEAIVYDQTTTQRLDEQNLTTTQEEQSGINTIKETTVRHEEPQKTQTQTQPEQRQKFTGDQATVNYLLSGKYYTAIDEQDIEGSSLSLSKAVPELLLRQAQQPKGQSPSLSNNEGRSLNFSNNEWRSLSLSKGHLTINEQININSEKNYRFRDLRSISEDDLKEFSNAFESSAAKEEFFKYAESHGMTNLSEEEIKIGTAKHYFHKLLDENVEEIVKKIGVTKSNEKEHIKSLIYTLLSFRIGDEASFNESYQRMENERQRIGAKTGEAHASKADIPTLKKLCYALQDISLQSIDKADLQNFLKSAPFTKNQPRLEQKQFRRAELEVQKDDFTLVRDLISELRKDVSDYTELKSAENDIKEFCLIAINLHLHNSYEADHESYKAFQELYHLANSQNIKNLWDKLSQKPDAENSDLKLIFEIIGNYDRYSNEAKQAAESITVGHQLKSVKELRDRLLSYSENPSASVVKATKSIRLSETYRREPTV